jgi:hypothetical protein
MTSITLPLLIPFGGFLALAFFIPALCWRSVSLKRQTRDTRYKCITDVHIDGHGAIKESIYYKIYPHDDEDESDVWRYIWLPLGIIAAMCVYFSLVLIYTPDLVFPDAMKNFLLLGWNYTASDPKAVELLDKSLYVMCYAFIGWYIWTVSTIFSRVLTLELAPATYYGVLMRLVAAVFTALVALRLSHLYLPSEKVMYVPVEAIGFGAGLFPDSLLAAINQKLRQLLLGKGAGVEELPLDLVQGISPFRSLRLFEMGMDNCQNLAAANAIELYLKSNLTLVEIVDWIAQAQLAILVRAECFKKLQKNGYRNIVDFQRGCMDKEVRPVLADITGFKDPQLQDLGEGMTTSPSYVRLVDLRDRLAGLKEDGAESLRLQPVKAVLVLAEG